jgi:beta-lactamase class D
LVTRTGILAGLAALLAAPAYAAPVCVLLVDAASGEPLAREGNLCGQRTSPASTFKVALAVMGYEAGILVDREAPAWPYRAEYKAWMKSWKRTVDPTSWLADSVVWYSREITRRLGAPQFQRYVERLDYGNRDLSGDPGRNNGLTGAWLGSSLTISPDEQAAFLRRLLDRQLPVSAEAMERAVAILPRDKLADGWMVMGKTGTGFRTRPDGTSDRARQFGWFVGWAERAERRIVFARLEHDEAKNETYAGPRAKEAMLAELPRRIALPR